MNHALAEACRSQLLESGHEVILHDLYAEGFDPLLKVGEAGKKAVLDEVVRRHCDDLAQCDGIVIVHPNWWGMPPAILTGWVDRVVRSGVAYRFVEGDKGEGVPVGLLKARAALVINTSNTSEARETKEFGDPLDTIWRNCIFGLCGVKTVERIVFRIVVTSDLNQRRQWLEQARASVSRLFA